MEQVQNHYLTREIVSVDIPDCSEIIAKFVYNYFVPDESINGEGYPGIGFGGISYNTQTEVDRRTLKKSVPRHVILEVKGTQRGDYTWASNEIKNNNIKLTDNFVLQKSQNEFDVTTPGMSMITIEDTHLVNRLKSVVNAIAENILPDTDIFTEPLSQSDLANIINNVTTNNISGELLLDILSDLTDSGVTYVNESQEEIREIPIIKDTAVRFEMQVHDKFIADVTKNIVSNPFSIAQTKMLLNFKKLEDRQENTRNNSHNEILDSDYEPEIIPLNRPRPVMNYGAPKMGTCGYVIDKYEIGAYGKKNLVDSLVINDTNIRQVVDSKIKYGTTYSYTASTLCLLEFTTDLDDIKNIKSPHKVSCLIKSRPTKQAIVKCIESNPPPPPDGIFYTFDYDTNSLVINWQYPVTPQRDVKKFQIFRRKSVNEAFYLLAQYDFNDAKVKYRNAETIDQALNIRMPGAYTSYTDHEFDQSGDYIYAIVSVDAHNLSSNYSAQTHVTFNRVTNKINIKNISQPGAPKQYPNFYISPTMAQNITENRLTEDVIMDSQHEKMRIYFDPEYLVVTDAQNKNQKLLVTSNEVRGAQVPSNKSDVGMYKFQILNLDRQKMQILEIKLNNKTNIQI